MKVQAINSIITPSACQPIKGIEFNAKKAKKPVSEDLFANEKKLDLACHIAAYYKTKYEHLLKAGTCLV